MARRGKTRYHEAAHVISAWKLMGVRTEVVDIGIKGESGGLTVYAMNEGEYPIEEQIAICLAGGIAEALHSLKEKKGPPSNEALASDFVHAAILISLYPKEERMERLYHAQLIAESVVLKNWDLIDKLAQLLYDDPMIVEPLEKLGL